MTIYIMYIQYEGADGRCKGSLHLVCITSNVKHSIQQTNDIKMLLQLIELMFRVVHPTFYTVVSGLWVWAVKRLVRLIQF